MNNQPSFLAKANGKVSNPNFIGNETLSIKFLRSPRERAMIPSTLDKVEFSIWAEKEPGEPPSKRFKSFYEYFGKPKFRPVDNLSNEQLPDELKKLQEVMKAKQIIINTYTEVADRDLYRFITKELFCQLTTGNIYSSTLKIVYEEFHPNSEYLIKKATSDFIRLLFETYLGPNRINHLKNTLGNYKEIKRELKKYDESIGLDYLEIDEIAIDGNTASVIMELGFYGILNDVFVHLYKGDCHCFLEHIENSWQVTHCSLPNRVK